MSDIIKFVEPAEANSAILSRYLEACSKGDETAMEREVSNFCNTNMGLAKYMVNRSCLAPAVAMDYDDMLQEALILMCKAFRDYPNSKKNCSLVTYVGNRIGWGLLREYKLKANLIRVPVNLIAEYFQYGRAGDEGQTKDLTRELTQTTNLPNSHVKLARVKHTHNLLHVDSLDKPIGRDSDDAFTLYDKLAASALEGESDENATSSNVAAADLHLEIGKLLEAELTPWMADALHMYFGFNADRRRYTLEEIASVMGINRVTVKNLLDRIIAKLRYKIERDGVGSW